VIESLEPTETSVELSSIQPQNVQSISEVFSMSEKDVQRFDWIPNQYSVLFYYPDEIAFFDQETKQSIGKIAVPGVTTSATSPSGKQLAILPGGSEILVYQIPEGENIFSLKGHTGAVSGLNYSPDGKNLASSADDNSIRIWDTTAGELLQTWSLDYWPETIVYSPDGKQLAAIDNQNFTIHILSTNDGAETGTLTWTEHASPVLYEAIFSPDWSSVAWIARGTVQLMDVDTGDLGATLSHEDFVSSAAWTPDGELIVTAAAATVNGDFKPVANFWDPQSGRQINQLIFDNPILSLSFTTDGHLIGILDSSSYWSAWGINP
jgi:WD40 repeat protein